MSTTMELALSDITVDPNLQPRVGGLDANHVRELQDILETCPPIRVVKKDDIYILVDGFHRFAAAQNLQHENISAEIIEAKDNDDLFALAFSLNATHGRPLTLSDRRAYAGKLLQAHSDWSDREIGRHCGLMQPTVAKVRQELEQAASIPVVTERTGRDGQKYSVPAKQPEKKPQAEVAKSTLTPAQRASQRKITDYLMKLADMLEEQDNLPDFNTLTDAAEACRAVLGDELSFALADRLGWTSHDILEIAKLLGYRRGR